MLAQKCDEASLVLAFFRHQEKEILQGYERLRKRKEYYDFVKENIHESLSLSTLRKLTKKGHKRLISAIETKKR